MFATWIRQNRFGEAALDEAAEAAVSSRREQIKVRSVGHRRYRLAAVFHRPHPYFCKFFQRLAAHPAIDLTVFFYSDLGIGGTFDAGYNRSVQWDADLLSGYDGRFPRNYAPQRALNRFFGMFHPSLVRALGHGYDAVIFHGWWGASTWLAMISAFLRGVPVLIHSDKNAIEPKGVPHGNLRDFVLPPLFRRISGFLTVGRRNAEFYRKMGVPAHKMFAVPLAVDNDFFQAERQRLQPRRAAIREALGISADAVVFLYVGRLHPEKGLKDLLRAFSELPGASAHLIIVGDGPERPNLEAHARDSDPRHVHFLGLQNYSELPVSYAISDVFVLPSHRENWGAVVNEAMNFGLPIVASRVVGAAADLVEDGVSGLLFEPGDVTELAAHLRLLAGQPGLRARMGEQSAARIAGWNFNSDVEGVLASIRSVTASHA